MKLPPHLFALLPLFISIPVISASNQTSIFASPLLTAFDYSEKYQNRQIVRETGQLNGIQFGIHYRARNWTLYSELKTTLGDTEYEGETQLGAQLSTTTNQQFKSLNMGVERKLVKNTYAGANIKRTHWNRNIQGTSVTNPLSMKYTWYEPSLYISQALLSTKKQSVTISGGANRTLLPKVEINLGNSGMDSTSLNLEGRWGYKASINHIYFLTPALFLNSSLIYNFYQFGKSDIKSVQHLNIIEPNSQTRSYTLSIGIGSRF